MSSKGSLCLYLTDEEREYVLDSAEMLGVTQAYLVRLLLRDFIGLPIGGKGASEIAWLRETRTPYMGNLTGAR